MKEIQLTKNKVAIVDDEDFDAIVAMGKWTAHSKGYAYRFHVTDGQRKCVLMQNVVADRAGMSGRIDHRDRDKLNNRRSNLRTASRSQNGANQERRQNNSSGYKGVAWHRQCEKWCAYIKVDGKRLHLGLFVNLVDAAQAYDRAARKYFGEFACLNLALAA